ncbi:MAG: protein-L-isoaspartate(D-aspartate) O-methyltransferase [Bacteroidetes bacterium]|nr:protein-L-isoaspartate(D-aspartate) O-methyltransferase [Bacteroidota bacterium]
MNPPLFPDPPKMQGQRQRLLAELRKEGITDERVLEAIGKVPRHLFCDSTLQDMAYKNIALPIADGQTISQPFTVARQTELLALPARNPRVLEIGTGSGYQAAVLCAIGAAVFSIERSEQLHRSAKELLQRLGYRLWLRLGDGTKGWPQYAPYDAIVVTAGAPAVPQSLRMQLEVGGHLVIPVGTQTTQTMLRITRTGPDSWSEESHKTFKFVPLIGEEGWNAGA